MIEITNETVFSQYVGERIYPRWAKELTPTDAQLICFNNKRGKIPYLKPVTKGILK